MSKFVLHKLLGESSGKFIQIFSKYNNINLEKIHDPNKCLQLIHLDNGSLRIWNLHPKLSYHEQCESLTLFLMTQPQDEASSLADAPIYLWRFSHAVPYPSPIVNLFLQKTGCDRTTFELGPGIAVQQDKFFTNLFLTANAFKKAHSRMLANFYRRVTHPDDKQIRNYLRHPKSYLVNQYFATHMLESALDSVFKHFYSTQNQDKDNAKEWSMRFYLENIQPKWDSVLADSFQNTKIVCPFDISERMIVVARYTWQNFYKSPLNSEEFHLLASDNNQLNSTYKIETSIFDHNPILDLSNTRPVTHWLPDLDPYPIFPSLEFPT